MKFTPDNRPVSPTSAGRNWAMFGQIMLKNLGGGFENYSDLWLNDAARLKKILKLLDATLPPGIELSDDSITAQILQIFCLTQWAEENYNVFEVTSSLLAGLLMTEPSRDLGALNLPFKAFHVRLPTGFIPIILTTDSGTETRWITFIMVNRYLSLVGDSLVKTIPSEDS
jgi:hypothetical protein